MEGADRPVTFALNGGPGASSVYLNFGAIGPKRVAFGDRATARPNPRHAHRQSRHWLDFTDLVLHRSDRHRLQPVDLSADDSKSEF